MGTVVEYPTPRSRGVQWADAIGTALVRPDGSRELMAAANFKAGALLGDSITGQHAAIGNGLPIVGSNGPWNWANWLVGAPFDLDWNGGVAGAVAADIFARAWAVPGNISAVFVIAGTNDVLAVSSSANLAARNAAVAALTGTIAAGLAALRSAGKVIAIATIPPNNAYTAGDSRIDVLDRVNAYIATLPSLGLADAVMDLFTACWDSAAPTTRVYKTSYNSSADGTHLSNLAAQAAGISFMAGMRTMYRLAGSGSPVLDTATVPLLYHSSMRAISGGTSIISTGGSGTPATDQASGWRSLRNSGSPTWVCSIVDRPTPSDWVGPMAAVFPGEKMQRYEITAGASGDIMRTMLAAVLAANTPTGISYGDTIALGADVLVESPVALTRTTVLTEASITQGTSPVDQTYQGTAYQRTSAGINSNSLTDYALPAGYRAYMRSRKVRIAENVNGTAAITAQVFLDAAFNAAGSATVSWGRPMLWRWPA